MCILVEAYEYVANKNYLLAMKSLFNAIDQLHIPYTASINGLQKKINYKFYFPQFKRNLQFNAMNVNCRSVSSCWAKKSCEIVKALGPDYIFVM